MTPSQRIKRREYGRQQNNALTNFTNSIPTGIPPTPPLRQYLRLSLNGAIKMGTQDQIPRSYDFLLLAGVDKNSHKQVKEITQNPDENPSLFLNHLMEAMINPASQEAVFSYIST
jgi:hypothetical protein